MTQLMYRYALYQLATAATVPRTRLRSQRQELAPRLGVLQTTQELQLGQTAPQAAQSSHSQEQHARVRTCGE